MSGDSAWVIEPGHGSLWLDNVVVNDDGSVTGEAWDDSGTGSALLPDDYRGQPETMTFPANLVLDLIRKAATDTTP